LGKTFAENMGKVMTMNVFSHFDFKFIDEKKLTERIQYHVAMFRRKDVLMDVIELS